MAASQQIFTNQTANGDSEQFSTNGSITIKFSGTFDGASISLQAKSLNDNDAFSTTNDTAITAPGAYVLTYTPNWNFKFVLSGAGASTNINAFAG